MKRTSIIAVLAVIGVLSANALTITQNEASTAFNSFTSRFSRNYKSKEEYNKRLNIFKKNLEIIEEHNQNHAAEEGYTLEVNKFADLTKEEFERTLGLREMPADDDDDETLAEMEVEEGAE